MYAVIKTGGKQYRVSPGDLLVVEKLPGDVGAEVSFNEVLMLGDEGVAEVGAPLIDGAVVRATLVETRKGDKVKVFKKIRRQGYRRTKGHRQLETVLRVTGLEGAGRSAVWDGAVDLTPRSLLRLRARGLAPVVSRDEVAQTVAAPAPPASAAATSPVAKDEPAVTEALHAGVVDEQAAAAAPAPVKKSRAKAAKPAAPEDTAPATSTETAPDAGSDA